MSGGTTPSTPFRDLGDFVALPRDFLDDFGVAHRHFPYDKKGRRDTFRFQHGE